MATTTVRLDPGEEETLDQLATIHGGRSNALREGLRLLAAANEQRNALADFVATWETEDGPVTEEAITKATKRYKL
jgi:predicted transcriptional regulator